MAQYQKTQSSFKGITLKLFQNKYKNKPTSYDYKGDGDDYFLKNLGKWLKSPEIVAERQSGKPLKVGVRLSDQDNKRDGGLESICEITLYIGQPKQQYRGNRPPPNIAPKTDVMDDRLPTDENGEDIF